MSATCIDDLVMFGFEVMRSYLRRFLNGGKTIEVKELSVVECVARMEVVVNEEIPLYALALAVEVDTDESVRAVNALIGDAVRLGRVRRLQGPRGHTHSYELDPDFLETYRKLVALELVLMDVVKAQIAAPDDPNAGRDLLVAAGGEELARDVYYNVRHHEKSKPGPLAAYVERLTKARDARKDSSAIRDKRVA